MLLETLITLVALLSVRSEAIPENCNWSQADCQRLEGTEQFAINCDTRHIDYGGTVYSCLEECAIPDRFLCSYDYCTGFIEICGMPRHSDETTKFSTIHVPSTLISRTASDKGVPEAPTAAADTPHQAPTSSSPDGTDMTTTLLDVVTTVDSEDAVSKQAIPTLLPTGPEDAAKQECEKCSSDHTHIGVTITFVSAFLVSVGLNIAGFSRSTFKRRINKVRCYLRNQDKEEDIELRSEVEEDVEEQRENRDSIIATGEEARDRHKKTEIGMLTDSLNQAVSPAEYKQTIHGFRDEMYRRWDADPVYWQSIRKLWKVKRDVWTTPSPFPHGKPSMRRMLSHEEHQKDEPTAQQTTQEVTEANPDEQTVLLEDDQTGREVASRQSVTEVDPVTFKDIKLYDILFMVQTSICYPDMPDAADPQHIR